MNKYFFSIIILSILCSKGFSQSITEKGDEFFKQTKYKEAIEYYKDVFTKKNADQSYLTNQIAMSYYYINLYDSAFTWFKKIKQEHLKNSSELLRSYGDLLVNLEKYDEASQTYTSYNTLKGYVNDDENLIKSIDWLKKNINAVLVADLSKTDIDVGTSCLGIGIYKENSIITSIPEKDIENKTIYYDFAIFKGKSNINFEAPEKLKGKLNSRYYQGTPFLLDEDFIFFSSNAEDITSYNGKKIEKYELSPEGINNLKIYTATFENNTWTNITTLPFNSKDYSCSTPFLTKDKLTLYFASNMPGGYGGYDIYKVTREMTSSVWSNPVNLGEVINTMGNDVYPFIFENNFYYSSNGKFPTYGGLDVYEAKIDSNELITNVKNIGKPINSSKDDFSYILKIDGKTGYLASNREENKDLIYYFINRPKLENISSIFVNKLTNSPVQNIEATLNDSIYVNSDEKGFWTANVSAKNQVFMKIDNPWYESLDKNIGNPIDFMEQVKKIYLSPIMLYGKISNLDFYDESIKLKLFMKDENGDWVFEDEKEVGDDGDWSFHIRKDKEYKVEFYVGDDFSNKEIIARADENDKMRTDVVENLLDYELSYKKDNKVDGYAVQIAAYRFPENFKFQKYQKFASFKIDNQGIEDGIHRFLSEYFIDIEEARSLRKRMIELGLKDTLLVAIKGKKRVAIIEPKELATTYPIK